MLNFTTFLSYTKPRVLHKITRMREACYYSASPIIQAWILLILMTALALNVKVGMSCLSSHIHKVKKCVSDTRAKPSLKDKWLKAVIFTQKLQFQCLVTHYGVLLKVWLKSVKIYCNYCNYYLSPPLPFISDRHC